jgi:hypothetical protein
MDDDRCVSRGDARFKKGDEVMAHVDGHYKPARVTLVHDKKRTFAYDLLIVPETPSSELRSVTAREDLDIFVRSVARFKPGDKVMCSNANQEMVPGTVEKSYNPHWVYEVKLASGERMYVREDSDRYCQRAEVSSGAGEKPAKFEDVKKGFF